VIEIQETSQMEGYGGIQVVPADTLVCTLVSIVRLLPIILLCEVEHY
jgi:hypothetical protein